MAEKRERGALRRIERWFSTLAKYFGYYSTAVKLAQGVPILVGVAVVLFSPTAWLSATLRTWAYVAMAVGSLAGMVALGVLVARDRDRRTHAYWLLGLLLTAGAVLRVHLATIDVGFVERWTVLRPLQDFFLGSDLGEVVFNGVAAALFALMLFAATLGLPLFVKWRSRAASSAPADEANEDAGTRVRGALDLVSAEFATLQQRVGDLEQENRELRERLEAREAEAPRSTAQASDEASDVSSG